MKYNKLIKNPRQYKTIYNDYCFEINDSRNKLSRILQNFENGAAIISASRNENSLEDNAKFTKELEMDLKAKGLGYRPAIGGFIETQESGEQVPVEDEISFLVPYNPNRFSEKEFLTTMMELGKKYNQESILIGGFKELNNGNPVFLNTSSDYGKVDLAFEKEPEFNAKTNPYYTRLIKGNTPKFSFNSKDSGNIIEKSFTKDGLQFKYIQGTTFDFFDEYDCGKLHYTSFGKKLQGDKSFNPSTGNFSDECEKYIKIYLTK